MAKQRHDKVTEPPVKAETLSGEGLSERREMLKSFLLGLSALVLLGLWLTFWPKPPETPPKEKVGKKLFETFDDPMKIQTLSITRVNAETKKTESLRLVREDGQWVIADWYRYPAGNTTRMTTVVSPLLQLSVLEVRDELANNADTRSIDAFHAEHGVLDPCNFPDTAPNGTGIRVTVFGRNDEKFVDLVIGNRLEESAVDRDVRSVRIPGEQTVYIVDFSTAATEDSAAVKNEPMDERLSVKPLDWIEQDPLKISRWNILDLTVHHYQWASKKLVPVNLFLLHQDATNSVQRAWSCSEWKRANEKGKYESQGSLPPEKIRNERINETVDLLAHLRITGVLPKPEVFAGILSEGKSLRELIQRNELPDSFGFHLAEFDPVHPEKTEPKLVGDGGELVVTMKDGLEYSLLFGKEESGNRLMMIMAKFNAESAAVPKPLELVKIPKDASPEQRHAAEVRNKAIDDENTLRKNEQAMTVAEGTEKVRQLDRRFAPWFYRINETDYAKLRLRREDILP